MTVFTIVLIDLVAAVGLVSAHDLVKRRWHA